MTAKIYWGFGLIVGLIAISTAASYWGFSNVARSVDKGMDLSALTQQIDTIRFLEKNYIVRGSPRYAHELKASGEALTAGTRYPNFSEL